MTDEFDVIVIGAGPAGLAAAVEASARGLSVLLLDEQESVGGQIYRAAEWSPAAGKGVLGPDYERGPDLASAFHGSKADYLPRATVIDITADGWVGIEQDGDIRFVKGQRILIATGAMERPFPIPGWTRPGVMTVGAAQTMLKSVGAVPGEKTVLAGSGPLLYLLAWQLLQAGQSVQAILDTAPSKFSWNILSKVPKALGKPSYLVKGLRLIQAIRRSDIRHIQGVVSLSANGDGDGKITSVRYRHGDREEEIETDLLLLHHGVVPNIQLTQALRCQHRWDDGQLCWRPEVDRWGVTSRPNISVAGDGSGIGGAIAAEYAGRIAALGAAASSGRMDTKDAEDAARPLRSIRDRDLVARPLLDALYRPLDGLRIPDDEKAIACRCEEVTVGDIRNAVKMGCTGPNQLKAFLRAGMGPCQGRLCGLTVCETIASARGQSPTEIGYYRLRPPFKPVRLGALASMELPKKSISREPTIGAKESETIA